MERTMNGIFVSIFALIMALFAGINSAYAEQKESSLDAHVHGLSELTIAMEGDSLEIQFESPAMNLIGFEHKATSNKDIATVKKAESILSQPESLFLLSGANCQQIKTNVDISSLIEEHDHHAESHKDHDDHDHDDHEDHESHSEMVASYSYSCKELTKISSIKVALFDVFPGIHKINTMWVMDSKQSSATLTAKKPTATFR
jgi:hypothetical protein